MKRIIFFICLLVLGIKCYAQFPNTGQTYCYEFVESVDNGVKSYNRVCSPSSYIFFYFQDGSMGQYNEMYKQDVIRNIMTDASYYSKKAQERYNEPLIKMRSTPSYNDALWSAGIYRFMHDSSLSTTANITYRWKQVAVAGFAYPGTPTPMTPTSWKSFTKDLAGCYSFSRDRRQMISWQADNPGRRDYFRLIDVNSLKPSMDFLK